MGGRWSLCRVIYDNSIMRRHLSIHQGVPFPEIYICWLSNLVRETVFGKVLKADRDASKRVKLDEFAHL